MWGRFTLVLGVIKEDDCESSCYVSVAGIVMVVWGLIYTVHISI